MKNAIVAFLLVCALGSFILWMSGYDFDTRSPAIGAQTMAILLIAVFAAFGAFASGKDW